jgi:hypothetical protein
MTKPNDTTRTQPEGKLLLDDLWLDEGANTLRHIAQRCEGELGYKPNLEDFRRLLRVLLGGELDEYFADGVTTEVTDVVFKTRKRPRAQRYKVGDVFAIPLDKDRYAFGRIMRDPAFGSRGGVLVETFRETSRTRTYRPSIVASGRLIHPTDVNPLRSLKNRRWTVVASDDAYQFPDVDQELEFTGTPDPRRGFPPFTAKKPFAPGSPSRAITEDEWRRMEANGQSGGLGGPEGIEGDIRAALKALEQDRGGDSPPDKTPP